MEVGVGSRAARRISRVTPSQFDSMLSSGETVVFAEGRDETLLGRTRRGSVSRDRDDHDQPSPANSPAPASPSPVPSHATRSVPPPSATTPLKTAASEDVKRRSMYRSVGTASSPDLASLVRKAKEASRRGTAVEENGETARPSGELTNSPPPAAPHRRDANKDAPSVSASAAASSSSTRHLPSPPAESPPPPHPVKLPSTSIALTSPSGEPLPIASSPRKPGRLPIPSLGSTTSYVYVGSPPENSNFQATQSPSGRRGSASRALDATRLELELEGSSRRVRPGSAGLKADDDQKSSFSNTMRRTSRFFRKLGSSATPAPTPSHPPPRQNGFSGFASAPNTPTNGTFSRLTAAPPVPAIPKNYSDTSPLSTPKASVDILIQSPHSKTPLARDNSTHTLHVSGSGRSRRRSLSVGETPSSPGRGSPSPERRAVTQGGRGPSEETERLRSELQQWKLDVEGVLGSYDNAALTLTPNLGSTTRASSAPIVPRIPSSPAFAPLGMPFSTRPLSTPANASDPFIYPSSLEVRRPTWDANWANEHPSFTPSPLLAAPSTNPPPPPAPDPFTAPEAEPYDEPPSIRLVSPAVSASDDHLDDDIEPYVLLGRDHTHLSTGERGGPGPPDPNPTTPSQGLLETISESSPSSNLVTPPRNGVYNGNGNGNGNTTPSPVGPLILTQGPSPTAATNGMGGFPTKKQMARQSVVAYPATSRASTTSLSSVHSDGLEVSRRGSTVSAEGGGSGSGGEAEESFEERARRAALRCWEEDEGFVEAKKIAEWLGSTKQLNSAALREYIDMFDFTGLRLDLAFRRLCGKLYLKAETQQVDRILEQFSRRYWENNPRAVYGSADIVHAVAYSLLLLNTDLHVVDTTSRMTRQQFVRNTVSAIHAQTGAEELVDVPPPSLLFGTMPTSDEPNDSTSVFGGNEEANASRRSLESKTLTRRSGSVHSWKNGKDLSTPTKRSPARPKTAPSVDSSPGREGTASRSTTMSSLSAARAFDTELETTLKDMYTAIKAQPIFQPLSSTSLNPVDNHSSVSLTPNNSPYGTWGSVNRTASRRSATSSNSSSAFKRSSVRGFGSFLGASSVDLMRSSSPTPSAATSLSDDNYSTAYGVAGSSSHHHTPTIGFANSLSHTIIREQQEDDTKSDGGASVTDEELALLGAPWAKEGLVYRKHYWESNGKRSKEKSWLQVFVVISQGELRMFRFDGTGTTRGGRGGGVGGGDWASSASSVGEISLTHALCSAMPPPGYSRDRPHCFVLTLPGGGSYFFQAGTQDLVGEWVATCNYWSARLSKEPLSGGVSNMEYGWNRVVATNADDDVEEIASIRSGRSGKSGRSGGSKMSTAMYGNASGSDRTLVSEWNPPNVPTGASTLSEEVQLESLKRHVAIVRIELEQHNTLRTPMMKLYSSRSMNYGKASANWEKKSQHLLSESVKYRTYIDHLERAIRLRALRRGQKEVENMLEAADDVETTHDEEPAQLDARPPSAPRLSTDSRRKSGATSVSGTDNDEYFDVETPSDPGLASPSAVSHF